MDKLNSIFSRTLTIALALWMLVGTSCAVKHEIKDMLLDVPASQYLKYPKNSQAYNYTQQYDSCVQSHEEVPILVANFASIGMNQGNSIISSVMAVLFFFYGLPLLREISPYSKNDEEAGGSLKIPLYLKLRRLQFYA